jgi:hypothetical protein
MINNTKELFSLGNICVSDFLKPEEVSNTIKKYELKMLLEKDTGAVRLESQPPCSTMWGKYWYRSSINQSMKNELKKVVDSITSLKNKDGGTWLDIACNDGTLLSYVPSSYIKYGVDPADDSFKNESSKYGTIVQDYFSKSVLPPNFKADVITTIAMFYDISNPDKFVKDIYDTLEDNGVWVVQMSYTPLMIKQLAFDNICHEHMYYYSLFNIKTIFERNGFRILNCELNDVNGGSFRVYAVKDIANLKNFGNQQKRDVFQFNVNALLEYEKSLELDNPETWLQFYNEINELKEKTIQCLNNIKAEGKRVYGYGASTKGNTLLQYFGINSNLVERLVERSPYKFGLVASGSNIPIISEDEMRIDPPDYLLILPWHFINEFVEREKEFLKNGGKFIVPCPKFEIIEKV